MLQHAQDLVYSLISLMPRLMRQNADIAAHYGFEIIIKSLPDMAYQEWCKI